MDSDSDDVYLAPAEFVDSDHPAIVALRREDGRARCVAGREGAALLSRGARDPLRSGSRLLRSRRSTAPRACCARARGYCVGKAALFAALCRAGGIPARVAFADVTNHLSSEKLREKMGTNYFAWHGFTEVQARRPLGQGEPDLQFDAVRPLRCRRRSTSTAAADALLQAYDGEGRTFMRYEVMHGAFHDVPAKFLIAEMARRYPT